MIRSLLLLLVAAAVIRCELPAQSPEPDGFELSLWAREPLLRNPVSISFDNEGRLYAVETTRRGSVDIDIRSHKALILEDLSNQSVDDLRAWVRRTWSPERSSQNKKWPEDHNGDGSRDWHDLTELTESIRLLEDTDHDGKADRSTEFATGFNEEITGVIEGVMWHDSGAVFATVFPDLWRLRDEDGDGRADVKESVFRGFGVHAAFDGHDIHGLTVGPDGKLYFSVGDNGFSVTTKEGIRLHHPNTGGVLRCNFDGSGLAVFAIGLRNPQEIAFDQYGYLFSVDNDGDIKDEQERFVYISEGSDSGWRLHWQFRTEGWSQYTGQPDYNPWIEDGMWKPHGAHERQPAFITPPISNYSVGPGGFRYNPGTALTDAYRDFFFLVQFPVAKVTAFRAEPAGASFQMADEHIFHQGLMISAVEFGNEGGLYLADWDGKWQPNEKGAIYKFDHPEAAKKPVRAEVAGLIKSGVKALDSRVLVELLGHADMRIRLRAQFELVSRRETRRLEHVAIDRGAPRLARVHALWGIGQLNPDVTDYALLFTDPDPEIRGQAAKIAPSVAFDGPAEALVKLLEDESARVRFQAAMALGKIEDRSVDAIPSLVSMLERNAGNDPQLRHAGVMGLAGIGSRRHLLELSTHSSVHVRLAAVVALRRLGDPMVRTFLNDPEIAVILEAARAIHDDFSIPEALPDLGALSGNRSVWGDEAIVRRCLSAHLRLGTATNAGALLAFAETRDVPEPMRVEAVHCLAAWKRQPFVDRVTGRVRTPGNRDQGAGLATLRTGMIGLIASDSPQVRETALQVAADRGIDISEDTLIASYRNNINCIAVLKALASSKSPKLPGLLEEALQGENTALRIAAFEIGVSIAPGEAMQHYHRSFDAMPLAEQQAAIRVLPRAGAGLAGGEIGKLLSGIAEGIVARELHLDVLEAAAALEPKPASVVSALAAYNEKPGSAFVATLHGGDPSRGKTLFDHHVAGQCVRCHAYEPESNVPLAGPNLAGIGQRADRDYLLRALVDPGSEIADGYQLVSLQLQNGESIAGTVLEETPERLLIAQLDGSARRVPKADVRELSAQDASAMPAMAGILTKREIRDLIAFLAIR